MPAAPRRALGSWVTALVASFRKPVAGLVVLAAGFTRLVAAQGVGSLTGTVRDTTGAPLAGAEVLLSNWRSVTTAQGSFRLDSLPVGTHLITIRLLGYAALRSPVTVTSGTSRSDYVLHRIAYVLPTVFAEARRAGIYATVGDTSLKPLAGVTVEVAGRGGGQAFTDSTGRVAFPSAIQGPYVVRAVHPGYAEERHFVELKKGEGIELAIRLRPSLELTYRADEEAFLDLGHRLGTNLPTDRLSASQLERYGTLGLCDVKRIAARIGRTDSLAIIVNGTFVLDGRSARDLCSWQAAEVELVEFGEDICRDVTRTLVYLLGVWCTDFTGNQKTAASLRGALAAGAGRVRAQRPGMPFVVIWERR